MAAIYDAIGGRLWRRISTCATRLVDGQGNFGNIDGDKPCADRYT